MFFSEDGGEVLGLLGETFNTLMTHMFGLVSTDLRDEIIVRYTKGKGTFSEDKKFITLDMQIYDTLGREDGKHQGVWHASFNGPNEILNVPASPTGPMNEPVGPVPHLSPAAQTKARWTFGDGSSISTIGPAMSHLIPLTDGSYIFLVTCAQMIIGGTGLYEGAHGVNQSLGATHVPAGVDFFNSKSRTFDATTLDTFRFVKTRYYRGPAA